MRQEVQKFTLQCLSPVHVGNGVTLHPFEYLYDKNTQEVYFLEQKKWVALLIKHHLLTDISREAARGLQMSLWEWLRRKGVAEAEIAALGQRKAVAESLVTQNRRGRNTLNDIVCQTATAMGQPYIPGSSIKGALRTGIVFYLLQKDEALRNRFWQRFSHNLEMFKSRRERSAEELETELLHKIPVKGKDKKTNAVYSALRGLSVSDAYCQNSVDTVVLQKYDATTNDRGQSKEHGISLYRECLPSGTELSFSVTTDKALLRLLKIDSFDKILQGSHDFIQQGISSLQKVFGRDYAKVFAEAEQADMLLGGGTGFLSKTLWLSLAPNEEAARRAIAVILEQRFRQHHHRQLDRAISPRTLKLVQSEQGTQLMGLCQIREAQ